MTVLDTVRDSTLEGLSVQPLRLRRGETVEVGPLSLDQVLALARCVQRIWASLTEARKSVARKAAAEARRRLARQALIEKRRKAGRDMGDLDAPDPDALGDLDVWFEDLLPALSDDQVRELVAVVVAKEPAWVGKNVSLSDLPGIISAVRQQNDPRELLAAFRTAARGWLPRSQPEHSDQP